MKKQPLNSRKDRKNRALFKVSVADADVSNSRVTCCGTYLTLLLRLAASDLVARASHWYEAHTRSHITLLPFTIYPCVAMSAGMCIDSPVATALM